MGARDGRGAAGGGQKAGSGRSLGWPPASCLSSDAPEARRIRMSRPGVRVRAGGAHVWSVGGVEAPTGLRRPAHARVWPRPRPRAASWGGSSPKAAGTPSGAPTEKEGWGCPDAAASRSCSPAAMGIIHAKRRRQSPVNIVRVRRRGDRRGDCARPAVEEAFGTTPRPRERAPSSRHGAFAGRSAVVGRRNV